MTVKGHLIVVLTYISLMTNTFPDDTAVKNPPASAGDMGSIPKLERSPGVGNGNPLQYSCLENPWTEEPGGLQSMRVTESDTA